MHRTLRLSFVLNALRRNDYGGDMPSFREKLCDLIGDHRHAVEPVGRAR
jgi:hypothetical protein